MSDTDEDDRAYASLVTFDPEELGYQRDDVPPDFEIVKTITGPCSQLVPLNVPETLEKYECVGDLTNERTHSSIAEFLGGCQPDGLGQAWKHPEMIFPFKHRGNRLAAQVLCNASVLLRDTKTSATRDEGVWTSIVIEQVDANKATMWIAPPKSEFEYVTINKVGEDFKASIKGFVASKIDEQLALRFDKQLVRQLDDKLGTMVGLDVFKRFAIEQLKKEIIDKRLKQQPTKCNRNIVIYGNPGVGKTTAIKMLYRALHDAGILSGKYVEVTLDELTENGVEEKMEEAENGMLFIDEAYGLAIRPAVNRYLTYAIQPDGGLPMVVAAGYPDKMRNWLDPKNPRGNPGLRSRFAHHIEFPNYTHEELMSIARSMLKRNNYSLADTDATTKLGEAAKMVSELPKEKCANARDMIQIIAKVEAKHKARIFDLGITEGQTLCFTKEDVVAGVEEWKSVRAVAEGTETSEAQLLDALQSLLKSLLEKTETIEFVTLGDIRRAIYKGNIKLWSLMEKSAREPKKNGGDFKKANEAIIAAFQVAFVGCQLQDYKQGKRVAGLPATSNKPNDFIALKFKLRDAERAEGEAANILSTMGGGGSDGGGAAGSGGGAAGSGGGAPGGGGGGGSGGGGSSDCSDEYIRPPICKKAPARNAGKRKRVK